MIIKRWILNSTQLFIMFAGRNKNCFLKKVAICELKKILTLSAPASLRYCKNYFHFSKQEVTIYGLLKLLVF